MKYQNQFVGAVFLIAIALVALPGLAGEKGGNGGDPIKARMIRIRATIQGELATATRAYLTARFADLNSVDDATIKAELEDLRSKAVLADVKREMYKPQDTPCIDEDGNSQSATAIKGQVGGDICFDVSKLATENAKLSELIALAVHEHAHHFGYSDKDHSLMEFVGDDDEDLASRFNKSLRNERGWPPETVGTAVMVSTAEVNFDNSNLVLNAYLPAELSMFTLEACDTYYDHCEPMGYVQVAPNLYQMKLSHASDLLGKYIHVVAGTYLVPKGQTASFTFSLTQDGQPVPGGTVTTFDSLGDQLIGAVTFKIKPLIK